METLSDVTDPRVVAAIEANPGAFFGALGAAPGVDLHEQPGFAQIVTDIPHPISNLAVGLGIGDQVEEVARGATARTQQRNVPMTWWIGLSNAPADLDERLARYGVIRRWSMPGMAGAIDHLLAAGSPVPGLEIRRVTDAKSLEMFGRVLAEVFGLPETVAGAMCSGMAAVGYDNPTFQNYLGLLDGQPVASSSLAHGAGVAGLYNIGTLPEARGRGIGAAMTLAPLQYAGSRGYRVAILHASSMGRPLYERLGFTERCTIGVYLWSPHSTGA